MKKFISNKYVSYLIGILLIIAIWFISYLANNQISRFVFPSPISTIKEIFNILSNSYIYLCALETFRRMFIGFIVSFALALIFGSLSGISKTCKNIFQPFMTFLKAFPTASILFLFLIYFGSRQAPIFVVILLAFPILYESVIGGITNINKTLINAIKLEGENTLRSIVQVKIPLAIPYIITGIVSSFLLSFKVEVMAEILTGDTGKGIGCAIKMAQSNDPTNMVPVLAYSIIAVLFVFIITIIGNIILKHTKKILY